MNLFSKRIPIEYTDGTITEIRSLSIKDTEEFRALYELFAKELQDPKYADLDINQGYTTQPLCKYYIDSLLSLVNLDPERIAGEHLYKLLFPHPCEDGGYERQGILTKFLFGEVEGGSKATKEQVDQFAEALGKMWATVESFQDCMEIMKTVDYKDLSEILKHRAEALLPPEKAKKIAMEKSLKARDEIREKLEAGHKLIVGEQLDIRDIM